MNAVNYVTTLRGVIVVVVVVVMMAARLFILRMAIGNFGTKKPSRWRLEG
jgi:hypothetical protein